MKGRRYAYRERIEIGDALLLLEASVKRLKLAVRSGDLWEDQAREFRLKIDDVLDLLDERGEMIS